MLPYINKDCDFANFYKSAILIDIDHKTFWRQDISSN